jgi:hypothetical protein
MPSKRDVLSLLSRDELLAVVDRFELAPPDRRAKDGLVETIAGSKKATLAEVLPELPRDRLKELCRALGLDDSGREKSLLVDRLGSGGSGDAAPVKTNGAARAVTPAQVEVAPGEKLTTEKLEGYLWSAADILRGSIDSSDYKGFIFGMLFLKRLSDRFDEECDALRAQPNADLPKHNDRDRATRDVSCRSIFPRSVFLRNAARCAPAGRRGCRPVRRRLRRRWHPDLGSARRTLCAPMAFTICCAVHAAYGCAVTLTCSTRRRSSERTKKT